MQDWYEVSFSAPGESEWDEPVSVLAPSFLRAAELRMEEDARICDDWLDSEWDAHVYKNGRNWYVRLGRPRRIVTVQGCEYHPANSPLTGRDVGITEAAMSETKTPPINDARLFDLVRYMRSELHSAELITDDEYARLLADAPLNDGPGSPSPKRLVSYDTMRDQLAAAHERIAELEKQLAEKQSLVEFIRKDKTDDEERAKELVRPIFGDEYVNGNSLYVPNPLDYLEELIERIAELERDRERLDWLLERPMRTIENDGITMTWHECGFSSREAIDAAMKGASPPANG